MRSADAPLLKDNDARRSLTELGVKRLEKFSGLYARAMIKRDVETVHDLRVASRRLQQILMTFASQGAGPAKKARAFLREIRRSLGALRNLDVMAKMADERSENAASDAARSAWTELKREIDNKRRAEDRQAERSLMSCDLGDFLARAKKCMDEGASRNEGTGPQTRRILPGPSPSANLVGLTEGHYAATGIFKGAERMAPRP